MNKETNSIISRLEIKEEDIKCNICNDRGFIVNEQGQYVRKCECQVRRESIHNLKKSGLEDKLKKYTLESYKTDLPFLKDYKNRVIKFINNPKGWFVMLGQTGLGKTHLLSALTIHLIGKGKEALYVEWKDEMIKSKNNYWNIDQQLLHKMKTVEVLYIDDFLKQRNNNINIPDNEYNIAMNVINSRYNQKGLITIISSEFSIEELAKIDGAMAGRIVEMCGGKDSKNLIISSYKDNGNYRLR